MTQDEIIEIAKQAGMDYLQYISPEAFEKVVAFVELVAQHEREACADIADYKLDNKGLTASDSPKEWWNCACKNIADAIRARGQA